VWQARATTRLKRDTSVGCVVWCVPRSDFGLPRRSSASAGAYLDRLGSAMSKVWYGAMPGGILSCRDGAVRELYLCALC
jgi:hypothetical protein